MCVVDERGKFVAKGKVASEPETIGEFCDRMQQELKLAGLEAGPLAQYLRSGLVEQGLPAVCIETRRIKAFASASPVKTDRKDAQLIALQPA